MNWPESSLAGTGRREHVDVFLCAPIKSLIFFLSFYVMSLINLLVSNVKRKLHRRDSSESSSGSPVEKRLKELLRLTAGVKISSLLVSPSPKAKVRKMQDVP